jgi:heme A synthase
MMTSHLGLLILFAVFVSLIFAVLMRDEPREQVRLGLKMFGGFVGVAIALGWLMDPLPLKDREASGA